MSRSAGLTRTKLPLTPLPFGEGRGVGLRTRSAPLNSASPPTPVQRGRAWTGFTLIELLVVITIIVVLLALLTPALDQAIYQTELAVCEATLKTISGGVLIYTQEYRRSYPHRALVAAHKPKPVHIYNGDENLDDRKVVRPYFSVKNALLDPLCEKVDFDHTLPDSSVEVSYPLWFGFQYLESPHAGRGMKKLGDRFSFTEDTGPNAGRTFRFNLLASDMDVISLSSQLNFTHSSHPDKTGTRFTTAIQDESVIHPLAPTTFLTLTTSRWDGNNAQRGPLDMNYAYDDGSISRLIDVVLTADDRVIDRAGQEMVAVDEYSNDFAKGADYYIPPLR
jgi:prepilin-type N-terminal cleavage/methylation domain-containing protein